MPCFSIESSTTSIETIYNRCSETRLASAASRPSRRKLSQNLAIRFRTHYRSWFRRIERTKWSTVKQWRRWSNSMSIWASKVTRSLSDKMAASSGKVKQIWPTIENALKYRSSSWRSSNSPRKPKTGFKMKMWKHSFRRYKQRLSKSKSMPHSGYSR